MANIRIIGPRSSGKTTYLAGLAYWPEQSSRNSNVFNVQFEIQAINQDTKALSQKAKNIILQGESLEPTNYSVQTIDDLPSYTFRLKIRPFLQKSQVVDLVVKDHPGEFFDGLEAGIQSDIHQEFINDFLAKDVEGCLIMLADWGPWRDKFYTAVFSQILRQMTINDRMDNLRIAIVMSKCERGEIWPGRLDAETDLFAVHLPQTLSILKKNLPHRNLAFFALSAFGVLSRNDPRPNRVEEWGREIDGRAVLRAPVQWRPYGMIAPLYWLNTGSHINITH